MKRILLLAFLISSIYEATACPIYVICGSTSVTLNQSVTYTLSEDAVYSPYSFTVVGGTVTSTSRSGFNYTVVITWNLVGTGSIAFDQDAGVAHLSVTVSGTCSYNSPTTPSISFSVGSAGCGSTSISYTATPPTGYVWFWQTSSTGTATTNSTSSYSAATTATYYVRARSSCANTWSTSSASTSSVTVNSIPASPTVTNVTACPLSTFTLGGTPGTNGTNLNWYTASSGGTSFGQGTSYSYSDVTGLTGSSALFYASSVSSAGCESASRTTLTVTLKTTPAVPTSVSGGSLCGTGAITLNASPSSGNSIHWYGASWYTSPGTALLGSSNSYTTPSLSVTTNYYARSYNSTSGCESAPQLAAATINVIPIISVASAQTIFSGSPTSLSITNTNNVTGTTVSWTVASSNVTGASNGSGFSIAQTLSTSSASGSATYTITPSANSCAGSSQTAVVSVYALPAISGSGNYMAKGTLVLDAGSGYDSYSWTSSVNTGPPLATTQTYSPTVAANYTVTVTKSTATATSSPFSVSAQLAGMNVNYVVTTTLMFPHKIPNLNLDNTNNLPVDSANQLVAYYDGLGRPLQTVMTQGSPLRIDVVTPNVYDSYGREPRKYLPVTIDHTGRYKTGLIVSGNYTGTNLNYNNGASDKVVDDARPFNETFVEDSPLSRPLKSYGPGIGWNNPSASPAIDVPVVSAYLVNDNTQEQIIAWMIDPYSGLPVKAPNRGTTVTSGYYNSGQLSIKSTKDEQGHEVREYTDILGHVILKKVQAVDGATLSNTSSWTQTYYIYDDLGRLAVVLSPEAVKALTN